MKDRELRRMLQVCEVMLLHIRGGRVIVKQYPNTTGQVCVYFCDSVCVKSLPAHEASSR